MATTPGAIIRVSTAADGTQANDFSYLTADAFSPDGTRVLFISGATNLVPGDTNGWPDLFAKDLTTGAITRVNTAADGTQTINPWLNNARFFPDNTRVLFEGSAWTLVPDDTNNVDDLFIKNLATGAITRVNTAADGTQANDGGMVPYTNHADISADGTRVLFLSPASNLVPGDTNGEWDLFVKNLTTGAVTRVNTAADGTQALSGDIAHLSLFELSPDGTHALFLSDAANLVPGDTNEQMDFFVKNIATGAIARISTSADPAQANDTLRTYDFSTDGTTVLHRSATSLIPGDTRTVGGFFVHNLVTGAITRIRAFGQFDPPTLSPDGTRAVFSSIAANLVPGDTNDRADIFIETLAFAPTVIAIAATNATRPEGHAGTTPSTFTATRSGDVFQRTIVRWYVDGSGDHPATAADFGGVDMPNDLLIFSPGESALTIDIPIAGDTAREPDEGFSITLRDSVDGTPIASAAGTIQSDEILDLTAIIVATEMAFIPPATRYAGPVPHIEAQWIGTGPGKMNAAALSPNWFLRTGDGDDAIAAHSGTNVLDGGGGSNFLAGGTGADTFFLDLRAPAAPIWSTLAGFGPGDAATLWGIGAPGTALDWFDSLGAPGHVGLTALVSRSGTPVAALTLAGHTRADLTNGTLHTRFGHDSASNSDYLSIAHL